MSYQAVDQYCISLNVDGQFERRRKTRSARTHLKERPVGLKLRSLGLKLRSLGLKLLSLGLELRPLVFELHSLILLLLFQIGIYRHQFLHLSFIIVHAT